MKGALFFALLITLLALGDGRSVRNDTSALGMRAAEKADLIGATTVTCEPMYGFLPCSTTLLGLLFMIVVYEVLLSFGQRYVAAGSDLFFETFGSGVVGSSVFQLFRTIPQVGLILVTGIAASSDEIKQQLGISMGLLVGKTIMSLTLVWGLVVAFGSTDMSQPSPADQPLLESHQPHTKRFSLTGYGISCDLVTCHISRIMLVSLIPFLIFASTKFFDSFRVIALLALIVTLLLLFSYFIYQSFQPLIQNRRLEYVLRKYIRRNLLQSLLTAGRRPNVPVIRELFHKLDQNNNSFISVSEMRALILGIQLEETGLHDHDFVSKVMEQFDVSRDSNISEEEFVRVLSNWLVATKDDDAINNSSPMKQIKLFAGKEKSSNFESQKNGTAEERQSLLAREEERANMARHQVWLSYTKAGSLLIIGTAITVMLARPLVQSVATLASTANIPSFFIAYVVIPMALSYRQALRAISSARHKTEKDISLTLSAIYSGVFMNNLVGMVAFLALVYIRNMSTDVSAEILVILVICVTVGLYTSFNAKFPYWTCIVAFALYPISLFFIYFLTVVLAWS